MPTQTLPQPISLIGFLRMRIAISAGILPWRSNLSTCFARYICRKPSYVNTLNANTPMITLR